MFPLPPVDGVEPELPHQSVQIKIHVHELGREDEDPPVLRSRGTRTREGCDVFCHLPREEPNAIRLDGIDGEADVILLNVLVLVNVYHTS